MATFRSPRSRSPRAAPRWNPPADAAARALRRIPPAAWVMAAAWFAAFLALCLRKVGAFPDIAWHVGVGSRLLETGAFVREEPFVYVAPALAGKPVHYIDLHWLFQVIVALIHRAGGAAGLVIAKTAVIALAWGLILYSTGFLRRARMGGWLFLLLLLVAVEHRFFARPEAVTFFVLPAYLCLLWLISPRRPRALWAVLALQLFWVNFEGLFALGPLLVGATLTGEGAEAFWRGGRGGGYGGASAFTSWWGRRGRRLALLLALIAPVCLLNPYGLRGALFPLELVSRVVGRESVYRFVISEFLPPFRGGLEPAFLRWMFLAALAATAFTFLLRGWRRGWLRALIVYAAFFYLALNATRNVILFFLVAALISLDNLRHPHAPSWLLRLWPEARDRFGGAAARATRIPLTHAAAYGALCVFLAGFAATDRYYMALERRERAGLGVNPFADPGAAVIERVRQLPSGARVFNGYDLGGFWYDDPAQDGRFFIDGRLEVNGEDAFFAYFDAVKSLDGFRAAQERWGFEAALFSIRVQQESSLAAYLSRGEEWIPVEASLRAVMFVRAPLAGRLGWRRIEPQAWLTALEKQGIAFPPAGDWLGEARRGLLSAPPDAALSYSAGTVAYTLGWSDLSERFFRLTLQRDPGFATAYRGLLAVLVEKGYPGQAVEVGRAGVEMFPERFFLYEALANALFRQNDLAAVDRLLEVSQPRFAREPGFWRLRAQTWSKQGKQAEAAAALERARHLTARAK